MVMKPVEMVKRSIGGIEIVSKGLWIPEELAAKIRKYNPKTQFGMIVKECLDYLPAELANELIDRITSIVTINCELYLKVIRTPNSAYWYQPIEDYGMVAYRAVTTTGVEILTDNFQSTNPSSPMAKFTWHAIGTSSGAESTGSTALGGELTTTILNYNNRSSGTNTESTNNVWNTVGNTTVNTAQTIWEHGVFNSSVVSSGSLWDRSLFGASVGLSSGDSVQTDYRLTITAGG